MALALDNIVAEIGPRNDDMKATSGKVSPPVTALSSRASAFSIASLIGGRKEESTPTKDTPDISIDGKI